MAAGLRLADLLAGLSMVADLGFGLPPGTAVRSSLVAAALARRMDLDDGDVRDSFYTALLMHVGCVAVAHEAAAAFGDDIALNRAVSRTNFGDPGDVVITLVPELTYHVYESWRGRWVPEGLGGDDIPIASRVARAAMDAAFFGQMGGVGAAVAALRQRAATILDPGVVAAFAADANALLAEADQGDPRDRLLDVEPEPVVERSAAQLTELAAAFGDLADVKAPFLHGHAKAVARLAVGGAGRLGLDDAEIERIGLMALLHDVGRVGVSNAVWEKRGPLTRVEWEQVRMHAYHSERILATSPPLAPIATTAGMHHERLDGTGYHRSSTAAAIPMAARILAAADAFAAMTSPRPHRAALAGERAARELAAEAEAGRLDHDATRAVLAEAGQQVGQRRPPRPAGLSDREIEVLILIAEGCSNAGVAERLFISRRTAEHHVQHIYAKIGVSTRAAAALFAVQHDLVRVNG